MTKTRRVVVTGIGVVAGNAIGKEDYFSNCINGVIGIKPSKVLDTHKLRTNYFGEIDAISSYELNTPTDKERIQSIMELSISEMLADSQLTPSFIQSSGHRCALSFGTLLATDHRTMGWLKKQKPDGWLETVVSCIPWAKRYCGIKGGSYVPASACAAGTTAACIGFDLIRDDLCDMVIVGGADPLTQTAAVGFHTLKVLSPTICKPFDENRDGLNIGEGGAFFAFEELEHALSRGAKIYGEVLGHGLSNDAYHITTPDPSGDGAITTISMALKEAGITMKEIDYINAHGTGTLTNDKVEATAFSKLLKEVENTTYISSTKSMIGHCMGAAGSLELALTLLCLKEQIIPPTATLKTAMSLEQETLRLPCKAQKANIQYALSTSFAFAGHAAALLLGAIATKFSAS